MAQELAAQLTGQLVEHARQSRRRFVDLLTCRAQVLLWRGLCHIHLLSLLWVCGGQSVSARDLGRGSCSALPPYARARLLRSSAVR